MSEPLESRVRGWLKKEGYVFELEVARCFQETGFTITISDYAVAPGGGVPREIDVVATHNSTLTTIQPFAITFVCECKYSRDAPWVIFKSSANDDSRRMAEYLYRFGTKGGRAALLEIANVMRSEGMIDLLRLPKSMGHGVRVALKENQKTDRAYGAITKVCDASAAMVAEKEQGLFSYAIILPVIFLQGQIFECAIDESLQLMLTEVKQSTLLWRRPTTQSSIVPVDIVTESAMASFIQKKFVDCEQARAVIETRLPETRDAALISLAAATF